ncbi:hypothetical protein ACQ4LE_002683, partial [Meloidogyne hapla]
MANNIIESNRRKEKLKNDGFLYVFDRVNATKTIKFWRCELKDECRGRIHTDMENNFLKIITEHTHEANISKVEALKIVTAVRRRAIGYQEPPAQIRANVITNSCISSPVLAQLPSANSIKKIIKRARKEKTETPSIPKQPVIKQSMNELIINAEYQAYQQIGGTEGDNFIADSNFLHNNEPQQLDHSYPATSTSQITPKPPKKPKLSMKFSMSHCFTDESDSKLLSKRKKEKLEIDGFIYIFEKNNAIDTIKFWRCERKNECRGRIHTDPDNNFLKMVTEHTHEAISMNEAKRNIKQLKNDSDELEVGDASLADISKDGIKKSIKRVRKRARPLPPVPNSAEELEIPREFQVYIRGEGCEFEQFLLADSGMFKLENDQTKEHRILIFSKASNATWANSMYEIFADGSFAVIPPPFVQVFALLTRRGKWIFPIVYCLLTGKSRGIYEKMFQMIRNAWPDFNPTLMSLDFDQPIIDAVKIIFPNIRLNGCLFHLFRNIRKRLAEEDLIQKYRSDPIFAECVRMFTGLAFVPVPHLTNAIQHLNAAILPELDQFIGWFLLNYTGVPLPDGTLTRAKFPIEFWNVYDRMIYDVEYINVESAYRRLHTIFSCANPNIWRFIEVLRTEQRGRDADFERFLMGEDPP